MLNFSQLEETLMRLVRPTRRPVAVAFLDEPPAGVPRLQGSQPSGCSFWRLAAEGRTFFTAPADHYNCPIGSHTHGIPLPSERAHELSGTLELMGQIGYIRLEEIPDIPTLAKTPRATVYAPLADSPTMPDAVLVCGRPAQLMRLHEAATRAGVAVQPLLGRPTCMAIPATLAGGMASSLGCVGNRVYTELAEDELYTVVSGRDVARLVDALSTIDSANATLATYHADRRRQLTSV